MTRKILVSGLINIETTLQIDQFPIDYFPVRYPFFGVNSTISGVGYNIAKALTVLGDEVHFVSLIGRDMAGGLVHLELDRDRIPGRYVLPNLEQTSQSVILYEPSGRRQIHTDLKDIQEQLYPDEQFEAAAQDCSLLVLCNINFSRPWLAWARQAGKTIATDVHTIADLDDAYNADFMRAAHILFMSDEALPCSPEEWAGRILDHYGSEIVVIGLGAKGVLLAVRRDNFVERVPAVQTRPVVNTIGAGDALFSSFLHAYWASADPYVAIRQAVVFASYKIGATGAAEGFLDQAALTQLSDEVWGQL